MKQTLSYNQRLHQRDDFESALKTKALTDKWLAIHWERSSKGMDRLGIVVSKRTVPKAAARNRIKRLVREVFRTSVCQNTGSFNIVIRLRKNIVAEETIEFKRTMSRLLMKVRMTEYDAPVPFVHKGLSVSD